MRSGSDRCIWCTCDGKYAPMSRPLITILPLPVRTRTRATAVLRRPVDWTRGLDIEWTSSTSGGLGAGVFERQRLRALCSVGMLGPRVDLELGDHLPAETVVRQHAFDRAPHGF